MREHAETFLRRSWLSLLSLGIVTYGLVTATEPATYWFDLGLVLVNVSMLMLYVRRWSR